LVLKQEWWGSLNHESNGSDPFPVGTELSHAGFERKNWTVYVRTLVSYATIDDNPDISEYVGRGDVNVFMSKR
jgi:phospholipase A1